MKVYKNTKIYILCLANTQTGGPESLHTLRYYLEKKGLHAQMAYINAPEDVDPITWTPEKYHKYLGEKYSSVRFEDIEDEKKNIVIGFESFSNKLKELKYCRLAIWWLSVRFYDGDAFVPDYVWTFRLRGRISCYIRTIFQSLKKRKEAFPLHKAEHFASSKYAQLYLKKRGINANYMIGPLGKDFLNKGFYNELSGREDIVLYNPGKNSKIMEKLLKRNKFNYVAMKGYTPQQLVELMRKSKLYLDFGDFPGPERLPKETVWNGCNILVGKKHAAANNVDVGILEKYKIRLLWAPYVEHKIKIMLEKYEVQNRDFDHFRNWIATMGDRFETSIQQNFVREDIEYK